MLTPDEHLGVVDHEPAADGAVDPLGHAPPRRPGRARPRTAPRTRRRRSGPRCRPGAGPAARRSLMATSRRSPRLWPRLSLTTLKWSRSRKSTATRRWWRRARARAPVEAVDQQRAVGQAGERVVGGLVGQAVLEGLALAQVVHDDRVVDLVVLGSRWRSSCAHTGMTPPSGRSSGDLTRPRALGVHHRQDLGDHPRWRTPRTGRRAGGARWSAADTPRKRRAGGVQVDAGCRAGRRWPPGRRWPRRCRCRRCISRWDCLRSVMSSIAPMAPVGTPVVVVEHGGAQRHPADGAVGSTHPELERHAVRGGSGSRGTTGSKRYRSSGWMIVAPAEPQGVARPDSPVISLQRSLT